MLLFYSGWVLLVDKNAAISREGDIIMKKYFVAKIAALLASLVCMAMISGCVSGLRVEFVQDGETSKVCFVAAGTALKAPSPVEKIGYSIVWDKDDFSCITENTVVHAICTPKQYTVTYNLGELEGQAYIGVRSEAAIFDSKFVPADPVLAGYDFEGWRVESTGERFYGGIYDFDCDITLVADWFQSEYTFEY